MFAYTQKQRHSRTWVKDRLIACRRSMEDFLFFSPKLPWRHPLQTREELAERGAVGEMEAVGYLGDAH